MLQPQVLPIELSGTLRRCLQQSLRTTCPPSFSTSAYLLRRKTKGRPPPVPDAAINIDVLVNPRDEQAIRHGKDHSPEARESLPPSKELVPRPDSRSSISSQRKVDVPMKVLPKAQITPALTLSPKERLQLEFMTRKMPKREAPRAFKERLLVYHGGLTWYRAIAIFRATTLLFMFCSVTIVAPAYYTFGSPWLYVAGIIIFGTAPAVATWLFCRPFVTWIYLVLPQSARQSPKAALEYARNLPETASLNVHFMRATSLPASVDVSIADLAPLKMTKRSKMFEWVGRRVDKGSWYRPNPTRFWVKEQSGKGKEARDVLPGIWEAVYGRIFRVESEAAGKWKNGL